MKCALLCFILVGFWRSIYCVQGETFEYECDILQRLGSLESKIVSLENKAIVSEKVVAELEKVNKDLESKVNDLEAKVNASDKVIADPERISDLESKVNEQEQLIIGLTNTVATLEEPVSNQGVIFHAANITVQPTAGSVIKFSKVVENTDDAYSITTGCFTAPRNGIYWFSAHVCTNTAKMFYPSIFVGETLIVRTITLYRDGADCSTISAVTRLQVNDLVCLKSGPNSYTNAVSTGSENYKTDTFMGALIHE